MSLGTNKGRLPILSIFFRIYPFSKWFFTLDFHPYHLQLVTVKSILVYLVMMIIMDQTGSTICRIVQKDAVTHAALELIQISSTGPAQVILTHNTIMVAGARHQMQAEEL